MGIVVVPTYGSDPATVNAANLDAKVSGLATEFNGSIDNDNIKAAAAIANSKLNLATITQNITHSGTMTHSGVVTMSGKDFTEAKGADIASAGTTTIWATDGNFMHITGTTTITSFGTAEQAGDCRTVVFDGALTLTHNATSLILPTGANITTAAGDVAIVRAETTANARVVAYIRKDGRPLTAPTATEANALAGSVVQVTRSTVATTATSNATIPYNDTIPQIGDGYEYLTHAHTPLNANNILDIECVFYFGTNSAANVIAGLFQDATANALAASSCQINAAGRPTLVSLRHSMTAGTTSATTFRYRAGTDDGSTLSLNSSGGTRKYGGVLLSRITVTEIKV
jgi:hypothetical protein